jgi:3-isopropylmalate/(R)-2-methylmalate dehydratase large subunit
MTAQTLTEKILSRAQGRSTRAGEIIFPVPDLVVVHDWYAAHAGRILREFGVERLWAPEKVMFVTDHEPVALSKESAARQREVREIAHRFAVGHFFDAGRGGHGHIFPVEAGFVHPGMFVEAYDTHVPNYGAVGALGFPLINEIVEVLALGSVWIKVPATVRIDLRGRLADGVGVRDFAQGLIAKLDPDRINYAVVEFGGTGMAALDIDARFTLCNTPIEIGAKSVICEPDDVTEGYMAARPRASSGAREFPKSDGGAVFLDRLAFDLAEVEPQVALPPLPDRVVAIREAAGTAIQHAFIGSCASGSLSDLRAAARILAGRRVSAGVRLFVTPGTQDILKRAAEEGLIDIFSEAGAILTAPGCGPCAGGRIGALGAGETSINTGTRNDYGRLGAENAEIYLASPASVAAAAVAGRIVDPRDYL